MTEPITPASPGEAAAQSSQMTYSEAKGIKPFDWQAWLEEPKHTQVDWYAKEALAKGWVTCACGNQCNALPRLTNGEPLDVHLQILGIKFHEAIMDQDVDYALQTLLRIEERTIRLLKKLNAKAPQA